ncbi:MAG TPA: DUF4190 domain-containing protein [Pyrinomonadaceae bacterium]|nr:DUF4190 domain-containing protein [Pyrinomonadaceae bacterium]
MQNQNDQEWTPPPPPDDSVFSSGVRDSAAADIRSGSTKALVYGILSIFCCPPIFGYLAFTTAQEVLTNIEIYGVEPNRKGMAQAGKVLAIIGIVLWVLGLIFRLAGMA